MYTEIELLGKIVILLFLRLILPIGTLLYFGEWIKQRQPEEVT